MFCENAPCPPYYHHSELHTNYRSPALPRNIRLEHKCLIVTNLLTVYAKNNIENNSLGYFSQFFL
jgi:hypothetical protein